MSLEKIDVIDLWAVDSGALVIGSGQHNWLNVSNALTNNTNPTAADFHYINVANADHLELQFSATIESVTGSPGASSSTNYYALGQGSVVDLTGNEIPGLPGAIPGTDSTNAFDSALRRGTNLATYVSGDWNAAQMRLQPSLKQVTGGSGWWPAGAVPATDVTSVFTYWMGHRMFNKINPATTDALTMENLPHVKGLNEVQASMKFVTVYSPDSTITMTAKWQAILYKEVSFMDPKQFYMPGSFKSGGV